MKGKELIINI